MRIFVVLFFMAFTTTSVSAQNIILNKNVDDLINSMISIFATGDEDVVEDFLESRGDDGLEVVVRGGAVPAGADVLKVSESDTDNVKALAPFFRGGMPFNIDTHIARDNRTAGGRFQVITFKKEGKKENELINNQTNCAFRMALDKKRVLRVTMLECQSKANSIILPGEKRN